MRVGVPALVSLVVVGLSLPAGAVARAAESPPQAPENKQVAASDKVLVRFEKGAEQAAVLSDAEARPVASAATNVVPQLQVVKPTDGQSAEQLAAELQKLDGVKYAEPDQQLHLLATPNDPSFSTLWGLHQSNDADIDAVEAWDAGTGSKDKVVVVIDTGIDANHPDLQANLFRNTPECNGTPGVDDDGNGFKDDCYGWDAYGNDAIPEDGNGHGTHVAGTIGATGNNGIGITGVNWNVSIAPCRFLGPDGSGNSTDALECMSWAASLQNRGVDVVATSNSWGGGSSSQAMQDAIQTMGQAGSLFVAAAGNDATDNDSMPHFPSSYVSPYVVSVGSTASSDLLSSFSNYGRNSVDLLAPGSGINSTFPGGGYRSLSGTSMATPHVAGALAWLKSINPGLSALQLKDRLLASVDFPATVGSVSLTGGRLNLANTLSCTSELKKAMPVIASGVGQPTTIKALNIPCAGAPAAQIEVAISGAGTASALLKDNGTTVDEVAGDRLYSGTFTPTTEGSYSLQFPWGQSVTIQVAPAWQLTPVAFAPEAAGTTLQSLALRDDEARSVTPPFPITFGTQSFTNAFISSNGVVSFGSGLTNYLNRALPIETPSHLVAGMWDDWDPSSGGSITTRVMGESPRRYVIEYSNVPRFGCTTARLSMQIVFTEGVGGFHVHYLDAGTGCGLNSGSVSTIGTQGGGRGAAMHGFNSTAIPAGTSFAWSPDFSPGPSPSPSPSPTPPMTGPCPAIEGYNRILGTVGNDKIIGTPGPDLICALGGDDEVSGLAGNDILYGGGGNDVIRGGEGNDTIYGLSGADLLHGGSGSDDLSGGSGVDRFFGGKGNDMCRTDRSDVKYSSCETRVR